jgi:putative Mg2+ transporter-C (MgtC) family protein
MPLVSLNPEQLRILIYVIISMILGGALGFERELRDKPAGLRTHMLVAGAAALLVSLSDVIVKHFSEVLGGQLVRTDPTRIIEAVVTGVSFLGAGTIIRHRSTEQVEGLTTAASLLFVVAIGVCAALAQVLLAIGLTAIALVTLRGVSWLEYRLLERQQINEERKERE